MIAALVVVPILAGLALYFIPRSADALAKWIGVAIAFGAFAVAILYNGAPDGSHDNALRIDCLMHF